MSFETTITQFGGQTVIVMKDLLTNTFAEVYSFSALLNNFTAIINNHPLNVIDAYSNMAEANEHITPFFKSAKLSPFVCRVKNARYTFGLNDYHLTKYISQGNALHGLIYDKHFEVAQHSANDEQATVTLVYNYTNKTEGFPFSYECKVEYRLQKDNRLTIATTITNQNEQPMPITDGWHPYFALGCPIDDCEMMFRSIDMLEFDEGLIPTGKLVTYTDFNSLKRFGGMIYDNCFTLDVDETQPACVLRNSAKNVQVEIQPDASYPYLQFFTPDHRRSIAIENLSAAPDAINNGMGLKILQPNEAATFATSYIIRSV